MSPLRLLPDEPLPPYAYVVGRFPHPLSDPAGHSFGHLPANVDAPDPKRWEECKLYLRGIDLFNHGYYWEAHEAWESVWHACGKRGVAADFFKALIKLAAAGVKVREGRPRGVIGHARRTAELLEQVRKKTPDPANYFGLPLQVLEQWARGVAANPPTAQGSEPVEIVFGFRLEPQRPTQATRDRK